MMLADKPEISDKYLLNSRSMAIGVSNTSGSWGFDGMRGFLARISPLLVDFPIHRE
jgi:hypothetical protein